jgi:hypothetical protein
LVDVVEGWLRADPDLKFKSAKKDAQKFLGVVITPRLFGPPATGCPWLVPSVL